MWKMTFCSPKEGQRTGWHTPSKKSQEYPLGMLINLTVFNIATADYYCCYCYLFGSERGQTTSMMPLVVFVVLL